MVTTNAWSWSHDEEQDVRVMHGPDDPVYSIAVASEMTGLHHQTLRSWDREGLVLPKRTSGGIRRYSIRDIERISLVRELMDERGLNRAGVRMVLDLMDVVAAERARADEMERMARRIGQEMRERHLSAAS